MTRGSLSSFKTNLATDEALRSALEERFGADSHAIPAAEIVGFAAGHGYDFTVDDIEAELSEADLEGVTGGASVIGGAKSTESDKPTEEVAFYYNKISFDYTPQSDSKGK